MDGGNHWIPLGDDLPMCSVYSIAIDFEFPNIMYSVVGLNQNDFPGLGIFKSTDAGITWNPLVLQSSATSNIRFNQIMIDPSDHNTLLSCQSDGLWRSKDLGVHWSKINTREFNELQFNPLNPKTIYAITSEYSGSANQLYKSIDGGSTFTSIAQFANEHFSRLALSSADTNLISVKALLLSSNTYMLHLSHDGGNNFQSKAVASGVGGGAIALSQLDTNLVYTGFTIFFIDQKMAEQVGITSIQCFCTWIQEQYAAILSIQVCFT